MAADKISTNPTTLQLRYLQTLTEIATEKNSTIIFPVPIDLLAGLFRREPGPKGGA
jgi:erythrocyte band 7 integral membrane protein